MSKDYVTFSKRIKDATSKLKNAGYVVINNDDESFAILAEKKKILCSTSNDFFRMVEELTKD